jgi:hypothetical protein
VKPRIAPERRKTSTLHVYFPRFRQTQLDLVVKLGNYKNVSKAIQLLVEREYRRLRRRHPEYC